MSKLYVIDERMRELLAENHRMSELTSMDRAVFVMRFVEDRLVYLAVNERVREWFSFDEVNLGKDVREVLSERLANFLHKKYRKVWETRFAEYYEDTYVEGDKEETVDNRRYSYTALTPVFDDNGKVDYILGVVEDITDKVKRENEILKSRNLLDALFRSAIDAIAVLDVEGNVVDVNTSFEKMYGYSRMELIHGQLRAEDVDVREEQRSLFDRVLAVEYVRNHETRRRTREGLVLDVSINMAPIMEDGKLIAVSVFVRDITEQKETERKLEKLAFYDYLTKIPNRRLLMDTLDELKLMSRIRGQEFGFMILDGDGFKGINDRFGHETGDMYLQEVANRLKFVVGSRGTVARLGGDEFAIATELTTSRIAVEALARDVLEALSATFEIYDAKIAGSFSIGIAMSSPELEIKRLMKYADLALYHAKETGKKNFVFYNDIHKRFDMD